MPWVFLFIAQTYEGFKTQIDIELRDRTVHLSEGQMFVIPRDVEHRPVARGEAHILLIEPTGTPNTGKTVCAATMPGKWAAPPAPAAQVLRRCGCARWVLRAKARRS